MARETDTVTILAARAAGAGDAARSAALRDALVTAGGDDVREHAGGLSAAFHSAGAALDCAVALQQENERRNRAGDLVELRVGLSHGEAVREDGGWGGSPLAEAVRLRDAAAAGQILAGEVVWLLLRASGALAAEPAPAPLAVPGGPQPVRAYAIDWEPPPPPSPVPLPGRLARARRERFVGRDAERESLEAALAAARRGVRRAVLISGEPGIGKTTLLADFAAAAHPAGATILYGRCHEAVGVPYEPFVEALGHLVEHAPLDLLESHLREHGGELSRLVPALARRVPEGPPPRRDGAESERYILYGAVSALLAAAGERHPVVLVLDDLHWADAPTLALLRHLTSSAGEAALLVAGTFRSTEVRRGGPLADLLADLSSEPGTERLSLRGLDPDEVLALMHAVAPGRFDGDSATVAGTLREETGGNPFFISELLRNQAEAGDARTVPGTVREVVSQRVARLGEGAQEALGVAAVIGQDFQLEVLARATDTPYDDLATVVDAAAAAALIAEQPGPGTRFSFAHALIAHTLYDEIGAVRRRRVHRRVAEALEELCGDQPGARVGELAHHWLNAEPADLARALEYARRAGDRAIAQLAPDEAVRWYQQSLELHGRHWEADEAQRCELFVRLGDAQRQAGDPAFRETLLGAARLARRLGDRDRLVRAALANSRGFVSASGEVDEERIGVLEAALGSCAAGDSPARAQLQATLAAELMFAGDWDRRRALSDEALAMARRVGDPAVLSRVLSMRFTTIWVPETLPERLANTAENLAAAESTGDPVGEFHAVHWHAAGLVEAGRVAEAMAAVERETRLAVRLAQPTARWLATYDRANLLTIAGELAEAERLAEEALQIAMASSQPDALPFYTSQLTNIRYEQGRLAELQPLIAQIVTQFAGIPAFRAVLALACVEGDLDEEARRLLVDEAATSFAELPYDVTWLAGHVIYAEVAAHLHDATTAAMLHERLAPYADQVCFTGVSAWGPVAHHLGQLATVLGAHDEAEERFAVAAEIAEHTAAPVWLARTNLATARMLLARHGAGDRRAAQGLLESALALARERGSATIERRAANLQTYERALTSMPVARPRAAAAPAAPAPPVAASAGPEIATMRREGEYWSVATRGGVFRVRDAKGLRYLATLIEHPGVEVHAADLVRGPGEAAPHTGDAGELLDPQAKAAYRARLDELREEAEEAEAFNDPERAERARAELEFITRELAGAVGLDGRDRRAASDAERARVNATRAIRSCVRRIAEHDPELGHHLDAAVRTGTFCVYSPGPGGPQVRVNG